MGLAFLSHSHINLAIANEVASILRVFGLSGFIAHRDLESGSEWREEIQRQLREASLLVAIVSSHFAESDWTDQEVGFALARGIPIVPINAGLAPYGFMGHIQGVRWGNEAEEGGRNDSTGRHWTRAQLVERQARLGSALLRRGVMNRSDVVDRLAGSSSWDGTRVLLSVIGSLEDLSPAETTALARAAASNYEVYQCSEARATLPPFFEARRRMLDPGLQARLVSVGMLGVEASSAPSVDQEMEYGPDTAGRPPGFP